LGQDFLSFLACTVAVIPLFKRFKISPVLGFLFSGFVLKQLGVTNNLEDLERLSELGVLFLLFEMGLELSLDRLKALAKYAFGMGSLQMLLCTGIFTACALPVGHGIATQFLEELVHAPHSLVSIRTVDEAIVIGAALSMSSSAFVLQLLTERGELPTRLGSATLGILLFQDIAVVPFLVLLPLIEEGNLLGDGDTSPVSLLTLLGPTALQTIAGLGTLLLGGRVILRRIFEVVSGSRNTEAFLALCLLTVSGAAMMTQKLGFSDTLGAFIAGVLLSETNYKTQVEADIKPFRGLLLGLFFCTTGASINLDILQSNWAVISWILVGLLTFKTGVIAALGKQFGLNNNESIRIGFLLSQGGEFAFVLLSLAQQLKLLPDELTQTLIIVVVMSMALTPSLADVGKNAGKYLDKLAVMQQQQQQQQLPGQQGPGQSMSQAQLLASISSSSTSSLSSGSSSGSMDSLDGGHAKLENAIVICGFGQHAQMLANMLESPLVAVSGPTNYVVFDLNPARVQEAMQAGFPVVFGDGSRRAVLEAAGVERPRAFVVCHRKKDQSVRAVDMLRSTYPKVPLYAVAEDMMAAAELTDAGATNTIVMSNEVGMTLGSKVLEQELGITPTELAFLKTAVDEAMIRRTEKMSEDIASGRNEAAPSGILVLDRALHTIPQQQPEAAAAAASSAAESADNGAASSATSSATDSATSSANGAGAYMQGTPPLSSATQSMDSQEDGAASGVYSRRADAAAGEGTLLIAASATMSGCSEDDPDELCEVGEVSVLTAGVMGSSPAAAAATGSGARNMAGQQATAVLTGESRE